MCLLVSQVGFTLTEELAKRGAEKMGLEIPREHRMIMQDTSRQSLATFSEDSNSMCVCVCEGVLCSCGGVAAWYLQVRA